MKATVAPSIKFATNSFVTGRPSIEHPRSFPRRYYSITAVGATKCQLAFPVNLDPIRPGSRFVFVLGSVHANRRHHRFSSMPPARISHLNALARYSLAASLIGPQKTGGNLAGTLLSVPKAADLCPPREKAPPPAAEAPPVAP